MTELQKEFEDIGGESHINSHISPDGKYYTQEYARWLENQVIALRRSVSNLKNYDDDLYQNYLKIGKFKQQLNP